MILPRPSATSARMRTSCGSRSHGRAPAFASTQFSTSTAGNAARPVGPVERLRVLDDARGGRRVAAEHRQRPPEPVDRDVVAAVIVEIAAAAEHQERDVARRRRPGAQHVADDGHAAVLKRHVAPFERLQVVVHRARAGVVDEIVHDRAAHAALEQRAALEVVRVEVAVDQDVGDVVVDQRALGVLELRRASSRRGLRR